LPSSRDPFSWFVQWLVVLAVDTELLLRWRLRKPLRCGGDLGARGGRVASSGLAQRRSLDRRALSRQRLTSRCATEPREQLRHSRGSALFGGVVGSPGYRQKIGWSLRIWLVDFKYGELQYGGRPQVRWIRLQGTLLKPESSVESTATQSFRQ
ncbi:hypothetical protein MRX96_052469, partial [Rhipicephalus microplus]